MRMNPARGRPASALLSELGESALAEILTEHSDQPHAGELASAIHRAHAREPLMTTQALVAVVRDASAGGPAFRTGRQTIPSAESSRRCGSQ